MKKIQMIAMIFAATAALGAALTGCGAGKREIIFADVGWDSVKVHYAVAGLVAVTAFGCSWKEMPGSKPIMHVALK